MTEWLDWAPLAVVCCHICEEFVWPGGFAEWYRRYRAQGPSASTLWLGMVNALLLAACVGFALAANTRWGAAALLGLCALLCSNGLWHAWASAKSHTVSPGVVTGILLYVPLTILQFNVFLEARRVALWPAAVAACVGGSYPAWRAIHRMLGSARKRNVAPEVSLIGAK